MIEWDSGYKGVGYSHFDMGGTDAGWLLFLIVAALSATLPVMAAQGVFTAGGSGSDSWEAEGALIGPVSATPYYQDNGDGTGDCTVIGWPDTGGGGLPGGGSGPGVGGCQDLVSQSGFGVMAFCGNEPGPVIPPLPACLTQEEVKNRALDFLRNGSSTARDLINTIRNLGTEIIIVDGRTDPRAGSYNEAQNVIYWDPYMGIAGINTNGTEYTVSPIMALAHEIAHAAERGGILGGSETFIMLTANQIAREVNAGTEKPYDTTRDNHYSTNKFFLESSYTDDLSIQSRTVRTDCLK